MALIFDHLLAFGSLVNVLICLARSDRFWAVEAGILNRCLEGWLFTAQDFNA